MVEAFYSFYNGNWSSSLTLFEEGVALATVEKDVISELICRKQIAYITAFNIDNKRGLKNLKTLYNTLRSTNYPNSIKKDISILKLKTVQSITLVYNFHKTSKIDSLVKYSK